MADEDRFDYRLSAHCLHQRSNPSDFISDLSRSPCCIHDYWHEHRADCIRNLNEGVQAMKLLSVISHLLFIALACLFIYDAKSLSGVLFWIVVALALIYSLDETLRLDENSDDP